MKKIIVGLFITLMCFVGSPAQAVDNVETGFIFGHLPKLSKYSDGDYVGYLFEGKNSTKHWMFGISADQQEQIERGLDLVGMDVVIEYSKNGIGTSINNGALYEVVNIFSVMNLDFHATQEVAMKKEWDKKPQGIRSGYFTNVSKGIDGSYEITIQEGKMGNAFTTMTTDNKEMAEYIQECVKGGKWLRALYIDMDDDKNMKVRYLVYKIQIIE